MRTQRTSLCAENTQAEERERSLRHVQPRQLEDGDKNEEQREREGGWRSRASTRGGFLGRLTGLVPPGHTD